MKRDKVFSERLITLSFFLLITAAASVFRITNLEVIEFKADETINLFLATRPLFGHPFPPGGTVSSVGLLNPPLFNYLLFPLVLLSLDPKMISFFIGLLNSMSVGFFFLIIKRYYGVTTAIFAASLWAFSPWLILFSRKIWPQSFLLIFLVPWVYSLHKIMLEAKTRFWLPYTALSILLLQLHQSSIFFLGPATLFLLVKKAKFSFSATLGGFVLGILPFIPYLFYVIAHLSDPTAFLVEKDRFSPHYFPVTFLRPLQIMSQGNFRFVLGEDMLTFATNFPLVYKLRPILYLEYLILPLGMVLFWKSFPKLRFLVYTTITLPILYFLFHVEPFMHYFLFLVPFLFLFLGAGFAFFFRLANPLLRGVSLLAFLALIAVSVAFNVAFFSLLNRQKSFKGDYGTAFVITENDTKERFKKYQGGRNYDEMILASYLPQQFLFGHLPVGRMIYPYEETRDEISLLEKRLKEVPQDPRIQKQLIAFYTATPPTSELIEFLKRKSNELPGYKSVYEEVSKFYATHALSE